MARRSLHKRKGVANACKQRWQFTSDLELGALAARIRPRLLILDHIIRMGATDEKLLAGVRAGGYIGKVVLGRDLDRF